MTRNTRLVVSLGVATLATGALFAAVFLGATKPPPIPADEVHPLIATERDCLQCHGPGKPQVRSRNHPLRDDCFSCHMWEATE